MSFFFANRMRKGFLSNPYGSFLSGAFGFGSLRRRKRNGANAHSLTDPPPPFFLLFFLSDVPCSVGSVGQGQEKRLKHAWEW